MKSSGKDLDRAYDQAIDYFSGIKERDIPRYVLVCDFQRFRLHDLTTQTVTEFQLKDLYQNVKSFGFMAGYKRRLSKRKTLLISKLPSVWASCTMHLKPWVIPAIHWNFIW
jgi:hypothetical protein